METQIAPVTPDLPTSRAAVSPWWAWAAVAASIAVWLAWKGELQRFPEWDESVFYSQSGGFEGNDAPPATMVASRESGPAVFLGFLRLLGLGVAGSRVGVALASTAVLMLACWRLEHHFGRWVGVVTALFFGTTWLYASYAGSFFAAVPASVLALLVFALFLDLRVTARPVPVGVGLGIAAVVALWFRPFESGVVLIMLAGHSLAVRPRELWIDRKAGVASAAITILTLFVIPWSVDSVARYGGIAKRFSSANSQGYTLDPGVRIGPYFDLLSGAQNQPSPYTIIPTWMQTPIRYIVVAVIVIGMGAVLRTWRTRAPHGVIAVLGVGSIAFYLFVATILADRYLIHGLVFFCLGAAILVVRALESRYRRPLGVVAVLAVGVWLAAQVAIAGPYLQAEEINGRKVADFGVALSAEMPSDCVGVARFGAPMWQLATACTFERQTVFDNAAIRSDVLSDAHAGVIMIWPEAEFVDSEVFDGWDRLDFTVVGDQRLVVMVFGADLPDDVAEAIERTSSN